MLFGDKYMKRIFYIWEKHLAPRLIELFDGREKQDIKIDKLNGSKFAKIHKTFITSKGGQKTWKQ
jgi:hypothetical protein